MLFNRYTGGRLRLLGATLVLALCAACTSSMDMEDVPISLKYKQNLCSIPPECIHPADLRDPTRTTIHRFPNGLTVFLSENHDAPKIESRIMFKVGTIHDPDNAPGLAHYLEHLLFKGTTSIATTSYKEERPFLVQVNDAYSRYVLEEDPSRKAQIYKEIDAASVAAARYYIPGEYARLISGIGGTDMNAATSLDKTVYRTQIPSNQLQNFIEIEYERFSHPVFRGFQNELETVYEEYNSSLDNLNAQFNNTWRKIYFGSHPYARLVLGNAQSLKNASPDAVFRFYKKYYTPHNMAIILTGDFETQKVLELLGRTFAHMPSSTTQLPEIPPLSKFVPTRKIVTNSGHQLYRIGWRFDDVSQNTANKLWLISQLLSNGKVGLLDRSLVRPKAVLNLQCSAGIHNPMSCGLIITATFQPGMSVYPIEKNISEQLEKIRKGDFDESMLRGIIQQLKLSEILALRNNSDRISTFMDVFSGNYSLLTSYTNTPALERITKADLVAFAHAHLAMDQGSVLIRKNGPKPHVAPLAKPMMAPRITADHERSDFYRYIMDVCEPEPIPPHFPDIAAHIHALPIQSTELDTPFVFKFVPNLCDSYFSLALRFNRGYLHDNKGVVAENYYNFVGSRNLKKDDIESILFNSAGDYAMNVSGNSTLLNITGLSENADTIIQMALLPLESPEEDSLLLGHIADQIINHRRMMCITPYRLLTQALIPYVLYRDSASTLLSPSDDSLVAFSPRQIVHTLSDIRNSDFAIEFYGPDAAALAQSQALQNFIRRSPRQFAPKLPRVPMYAPRETQIYLVHVNNLKQMFIYDLVFLDSYDYQKLGLYNLFNAYYGEGFNSVIFQALRENKSLCYSCNATISAPASLQDSPLLYLNMVTQNDKLFDALDALKNLGFPLKNDVFESVKQQQLQVSRMMRWREGAFFTLESTARRYQFPLDYVAHTYRNMESTTLNDLFKFYQSQIQNKPHYILISGDFTHTDLRAFYKYGKVYRFSPLSLLPRGR